MKQIIINNNNNKTTPFSWAEALLLFFEECVAFAIEVESPKKRYLGAWKSWSKHRHCGATKPPF